MGKSLRVGNVLFHWLLVLAWMTMIFTFSSFSTLPDTGGFEISDKAKHFCAYAILAVLAYRAIRITARKWKGASVAVATVVLAGVYGVTDEFHQSFIPGRMCEFADWLADIAGAIFVVLIISIFSYLFRRK